MQGEDGDKVGSIADIGRDASGGPIFPAEIR